MTARVLPFPPRGPFVVLVEREEQGVWLVVSRAHGWLHGDLRQALAEAREVANGFGVTVEVRP